MSTSPPQKIGLSLDPASLQALRAADRNTPDAALRGAAKQFEALFLNMMLKSMRDTVPQDGALDNAQTKMFTSMLDEQYSSELSQGHGLGLADMIVHQLGQAVRGRRAGAAGHAAIEGAEGVDSPDAAASAATGSGAPDAPEGVEGTAAAGLNSAPPGGARRAVHPRPVSAFRAQMSDAADAASAASGIPSDFMLAQAGLESGWGRHQPATPEGLPSHNLFGIKAGPNWRGAVASAETTEVIDGVARRVQQNFRAYGSYAEAFQDYASLLSGNARYARALSAGTPQEFAGALQQAGYATDPDYAGKVTRAIRQVTDLRA